MKKIFTIAMAFCLIACTFVGCGTKPAKTDLDYIKEKKSLVIGITEYEPINFKDKDGKWTGFDTEFAQAFAKKLGVEAKFTIIDWDNKYAELDSKAIDCIWNGMTITEEGKLNATISNPYVYNAQVVVMAKDKLDKYPDAASMKDIKFAVETGSAGAGAAKEAGFTKVTEVAAQSDALLEVKSGSADACIVDFTMATAMTGENS
ncbi:MAG: transporter substrate-binding domain-containing protein, partial [Oscillospiraceae bacterium]